MVYAAQQPVIGNPKSNDGEIGVRLFYGESAILDTNNGDSRYQQWSFEMINQH